LSGLDGFDCVLASPGIPSAPTSTSYSCPKGGCNGPGGACASAGTCYCTADSQCKSGACVKVTGQNDVSCTTCTGYGPADGFDCALQSPGIPTVLPPGCPAGSGYHNTTLACDSTKTNCYCNSDNQCPSGKCVPNANNNNNCAGSTCTGSGTPDYRGCQPVAAIPGCPIYVGCPSSTTCSYPQCYCTNDAVCDTGRCIPSSSNGHCSNCTGSGSTDDGHGCEPAPASIPCNGGSTYACVTTLTPAPVISSGNTSCLCVADSNCSSGKCVNLSGQCTGTCTGSGTADAEDCQILAAATGPASYYCNTTLSPTPVPSTGHTACLCAADSDCSSGRCGNSSSQCTGTCTGSGAVDGTDCQVVTSQ
jgi:hypothetical protein